MKKQIIVWNVFILVFELLFFLPTASYIYYDKCTPFTSMESIIFIVGIFIVFLIWSINLFIQLKKEKKSSER